MRRFALMLIALALGACSSPDAPGGSADSGRPTESRTEGTQVKHEPEGGASGDSSGVSSSEAGPGPGPETSGAADPAVPADEGPRCADGQRCLESFKGIEQTSFPAATDWWPYQPVLVPSVPVSSADEEHGLMAWSERGGGQQGNPALENSFLYLHRYPSTLKFEMSRFFEMLTGGALTLQLVAQASVPGAGEEDPDGHVTVRGREAIVSEGRKPKSNVNVRRISWIDRHPGGRQVTFILWSDPTVYSTAEVVAWANSLKEA